MIARMAHLSNRQQCHIRRNLAEQLVFQCQDKRTKLADSFHNADLTESPSTSYNYLMKPMRLRTICFAEFIYLLRCVDY